MKLNSFYKMNNVIKDYAWGSRDSLRTLFNIENIENTAQAELWMGAHPNGCSIIKSNNNDVLLSDFIKRDMSLVLGSKTALEFNGLPFLFKVLAADSALSIQIHPNKEQAEKGFSYENSKGINLNAYDRNYKDKNHKPELVFALTDFKAMNGFRPINEIITHFTRLNCKTVNPFLDELILLNNEDGLKEFVVSIMNLSGADKKILLESLFSCMQDYDEYELIKELSLQYPSDIGVVFLLLLNVLTLEPGSAMYIEAGTPHAYIRGTALEIMANSDNVLRAGLTPKHVDIDEISTKANFKSVVCSSLKIDPLTLAEGHESYPIVVDDFKFDIFKTIVNRNIDCTSAEILFCIDGELELYNDETQDKLKIKKGESVFIPASTNHYRILHGQFFARAYN